MMCVACTHCLRQISVSPWFKNWSFENGGLVCVLRATALFREGMGQNRTASSYGTAPLKRGVRRNHFGAHTPHLIRVRATNWRRPGRYAFAGTAVFALLTIASLPVIDEVSAVRFGLRPKRELFDSSRVQPEADTKTSSAVLIREAEDRRIDTPMIASLSTVSTAEAHAYLQAASGDEIAAAYELARHRNMLDGAKNPPDDTEVHHALFLLRRAQGLAAPSYDEMRVELRRRVAA